MKAVYYNQRNYGDVPYPSPASPDATVKTGGCGVCCASMAVESVTGRAMPPEAMARYALRCGARISGGTHMARLLRCLARELPALEVAETGSFSALWDHLAAGGFAVTSTPGDRPGRVGLLSTGAHLFCAAGLDPRGRAVVLDPNLYPGKFTRPGRAGRAEVLGDRVLITREELRAETGGRTYYLIKENKEEWEPMTEEQFEALLERALDKRARRAVSPWAAEEHKEAVARGWTDGSRPGAWATREETAAMILRALKGEAE